ncbi:MAG: ACP S-malonyltransferase [Chloroflexota bacterium]|nr:ACP S-malonyltransferase [Chloroflexota bacterium]
MIDQIVWMFPGQGAQQAGMGRDLSDGHPAARETFERANEELGLDLRALCFDGPQAELDKTLNAQPALLATSIAALGAARAAGLREDDPIVMGHSLGEFSALVAGGALEFGDALRLVRRRGELMQAADDTGGMTAVLGLDAAQVGRAIAGTELVVANDNAPGQVVISGPAQALAAAGDPLRRAGAKRVVPVRVSGAFHSPAMRPVAAELAKAIASTTLGALRLRVITNVDAQVHEDAGDLPALLERQVWSPVRWADAVRRAREEGASIFVEFGPGTTLTGLVKRIVPGARAVNVSSAATLEEALAVLR